MVRRWAEQTKLPWLRDDEMSMQSEKKFRCSFLGFDAVFWGSGYQPKNTQKPKLTIPYNNNYYYSLL
jgi:hypothetical protein